jgi:hypothetical protein
VAQDDLYFTGLATINPNAQAVGVTVEVYSAEGTQVATGTQQVPAGGRFSKLLAQVAGSFAPMTKGYFKVSAPQPVASFVLFGTNAGDVLSAIPAQGVSLAYSIVAADWPAWRGPAHKGVAIGDAPLIWSDSGNIKWISK